MTTADDIENERRRGIFDAGRAAKRDGYGYGINPHFDGLDHQIWHNGWMWEEDYPRGSSLRAFALSVLAILSGLFVLWQIFVH